MTKLVTAAVGIVLLLAGPAAADWVSVGPEGGPIYCGTVAPTTPPTIYVAANGSNLPVLKSTDGGASWAPAGAALGNCPNVLVTHPADPNTLYGVANSLFYRSTNGGGTWTQVSLGSNTYGHDIAINPLNTQVMYIPGYKYDGTAWRMTCFKSTNGGQNWTATQLDTTASTTVYSAAIDPVDTTVVYVGAYFGSTSAVFKSTDCGATWTGYPLPTSSYYVYSLLVSPVNHNIVFAGTLNGVCRSTDAGLTWVKQGSGSYNYRIVTVPGEPDTMYSAAYNTVYRSTDAGVTWTQAGTGLSGTTLRTVLTVPGASATVYCGSTTGMFRSTDYGAGWTAANSGIVIGKIPALAAVPGSAGSAWAEFLDNGIFTTTDDGNSWTRHTSPLSCGNLCNIVFDPQDPQRVWMLEASG